MFSRNNLQPIIYGPYISSIDGRKRVVLVYGDGLKTTMQYCRYLWITQKGTIPKGYEVDHIDDDFTNDDLDNLQLLTKSENIEKAWANGINKPKELYYGTCEVCGDEFTKHMRDVRCNWKKGKAGPFCSRRCAGKHNATNQYYYTGPVTQNGQAD